MTPPTDRRIAVERLNPDCRDGKHQACAGDAWDEDTDSPARCTCACHVPPSDTP